jgi:hypothetical protein
MPDYTCACGYDAVTPEELTDHIGDLVIPADDIAPDGIAHAEAAREQRGATGPDPAGSRCVCGFTAGSTGGLEEHLLAAFTARGATGTDGLRHG